jgi:hypothetical protein
VVLSGRLKDSNSILLFRQSNIELCQILGICVVVCRVLAANASGYTAACRIIVNP